MRCKACNVDLSDEESVKKDPETQEYVDMCNKCYYDSLRMLSDDAEFKKYLIF